MSNKSGSNRITHNDIKEYIQDHGYEIQDALDSLTKHYSVSVSVILEWAEDGACDKEDSPMQKYFGDFFAALKEKKKESDPGSAYLWD